MRLKAALITIIGLATLLGSAARPRAWSQTPQGPRVVAVRAGRMFDPKSGINVPNQVVLIRGDRITDVGPVARVQIPAGARVIDLSQATVLPGLIDGHVHLTDAVGTREEALHSATESLKAGFTTQVVQGAHGGKYTDAELRKEIDSGKTQGPRLMPAGPILGSDELPAKGPDAFRAGLRELSQH